MLNRNARWIAGPGLFIVLLFGALCLSEWYKIGIEANPETIEGYHFGAEVMIENGGEKYRSAETYASASLTRGLLALGVAVVFSVAVARRNGAVALAGYALALGSVLVSNVL
ncbi:MAG TPA: hypothetical protein VGB53_03560 [Rubricoccaceae bacterium]|jgi:hypothetical protein